MRVARAFRLQLCRSADRGSATRSSAQQQGADHLQIARARKTAGRCSDSQRRVAMLNVPFPAVPLGVGCWMFDVLPSGGSFHPTPLRFSPTYSPCDAHHSLAMPYGNPCKPSDQGLRANEQAASQARRAVRPHASGPEPNCCRTARSAPRPVRDHAPDQHRLKPAEPIMPCHLLGLT